MLLDRRNTTLVAGLVIASSISAAVVLRPEPISVTVSLLALGVIWLGLLPAIVWLRRPAEERARFPLMALAGLYYAVFYGVSVFLIGVLLMARYGTIVFYQQPQPVHIDTASMFAGFCGVALFIAAYLLSARRIERKLPPLKILPDPDWGAVRVLSWVLIAGWLAYRLVPGVSRLPSLGSFIEPAGTVALTLLYALWRRKRLARTEGLVFVFVTLPAFAVSLLGNGFLTPLMTLVVLWVAVETWVAGRVPWKFLIAAPLIFILVYPVATKFKNELWTNYAGATAMERILALPDIFAKLPLYGVHETSAFGNDLGWVQPLEGPVTRISHQLLLSRVVQETPAQVPYWLGHSYVPLASKFVPRAFWPDKPREDKGNEFGRRYGFLLAQERNMSINIPWLAELFANFGWAGIVVGMPLFGLLMAGLEALLVSRRGGDLECAIGAALLCPLFYHESNFSLMVGNLPLALLTIWIFFRAGQWALTRAATRS